MSLRSILHYDRKKGIKHSSVSVMPSPYSLKVRTHGAAAAAFFYRHNWITLLKKWSRSHCAAAAAAAAAVSCKSKAATATPWEHFQLVAAKKNNKKSQPKPHRVDGS